MGSRTQSVLKSIVRLSYSAMTFDALVKRRTNGTLTHGYYAKAFLRALKKAKAFRKLVSAIESHQDVNLMCILLILDGFHVVDPLNKTAEQYLQSMEALFLKNVQTDLQDSLANDLNQQIDELPKSKLVRFIYTRLEMLLGRYVIKRQSNLEYCFLLPIFESKQSMGPILNAIFYQYFAQLLGLDVGIVMIEKVPYCRIEDSHHPDGYLLIDMLRGELKSKSQISPSLLDMDCSQWTSAQILDAFLTSLPLDPTFGDMNERLVEIIQSCNLGVTLVKTLIPVNSQMTISRATQILEMLAIHYPFDYTIFDYFLNLIPSIYQNHAITFLQKNLNPSIPSKIRGPQSALDYDVGQVCLSLQNSRTVWGIIIGWEIDHQDEENSQYHFYCNDKVSILPASDILRGLHEFQKIEAMNVLTKKHSSVGEYFVRFDHRQNRFIPNQDTLMSYPEAYRP